MHSDQPNETATESDDDRLEAALRDLVDPERFRAAEARIAGMAPRLQQILNSALHEGGWFDEVHAGEVLRAATTPDPEQRIAAIRVLLADETRMAMLVGVAVGWELAEALRAPPGDDNADNNQPTKS